MFFITTAGVGDRRGEPAPAPLVHVALLRVELTWVHDRSGRWIRVADWVFAAALIAGGLLISDERSPLTIVLPSVAIGAVVAFLLIEPVTARAAFGTRA